VFGREFRLPCDLLFCGPIDKKRPTIDHAANLVDHLHDTHNYDRQHLKLASDRIKTRYDELANCAGYQENENGGSIAQAPILIGGPKQSGHLDK
jgi:hypothetical protein